MNLSIKSKQASMVIVTSMILGGAIVAAVAGHTPSSTSGTVRLHNSADVIAPEAPANTSSDTTEGDSASDTQAPGASSTGATTPAGSTKTAATQSTSNTPASAPVPVPVTQTGVSKSVSDNGTTTVVTCHYTYSDGSSNDTVAGSYPDFTPDPSTGFQSLEVNYSC